LVKVDEVGFSSSSPPSLALWAVLGKVAQFATWEAGIVVSLSGIGNIGSSSPLSSRISPSSGSPVSGLCSLLCPERIEAIAFGRFWYTQREYSSISFWDFRAGLLSSLGPVSEITCPLLIF
jgi:hypothetical protein